jgi:DNA-directed RNA polymerase subunit omega
MLIEPWINELLAKVDSRYTLVVETAKRARQIAQGDEPLVECDSKNPVTIAAYEILGDKVTYSKTKVGIK